MKRLLLVLVLSLLAAPAAVILTAQPAAAFDATWTRNDANAYSAKGVGERYVLDTYNGTFIDNDYWDPAGFPPNGEGIDCSGFVGKAWAVPSWTDPTTYSHPYDTGAFYFTPNAYWNTVDRTTPTYMSAWVWRQETGGPGNHMGLFVSQGSNGSWNTREARSATYGVVNYSRDLSTMINSWDYHRVDRSAWGSSTRSVAVQDSTGQLATWTGVPGTTGVSAGYSLGLAPGTSPASATIGGGSLAAAFQAAGTTMLWTWSGAPAGTGTAISAQVGMNTGTSPSITALPNGQAAVAFQAAGSAQLWTWVGTPGTTGTATSTGLGMRPGTSPSIAALPNGQVVVAFQANSAQLWTWTGAPGTFGSASLSTGRGMTAGSSPSLTVLPNGQAAAAYRSSGGRIWTWSGAPATAGVAADGGHTVLASTSPSIMALSNNQAAVAFQPDSGNLWTWYGAPATTGTAGSTLLGMKPNTSPSVVPQPPGSAQAVSVAFQANTGPLWTWTGAAATLGTASSTTNRAMNNSTSPGMAAS